MNPYSLITLDFSFKDLKTIENISQYKNLVSKFKK